jgi:transcriptional regulator with XRE-family HTH domain
MPMNELVARNVKRFREERRLSIGELGRRAGVAKQTIASLESGTGNPTVDTLERISEALTVSTRALLTEMGVDVLVRTAADAEWGEAGPLHVRYLGQVYGSGYVTTAELRLTSDAGPSHHEPGGRGSLRHCFVIHGTVRLGPVGSLVSASAGDFVRFPAEVAHQFEALSASAQLLVLTTAPQLTMAPGEALF